MHALKILLIYLERQGLGDANNKDEIRYCLVNRKLRQAIAPSPDTANIVLMNKPMLLFGVDWLHHRWNLDFAYPRLNIPLNFTLDEAWLKDASLAIAKRNFVQKISRSFEIKNFRMED
jgi:hypothetical protein